MNSNTECYELTLTQNYCSDWDFNNAIRELIQNGTDQEILEPNNKFKVTYDRKSEKLFLTNATSKLNINTLLLGRSSKTNNEDTVGQFGEGYKIAALVLNRLNKTFTIFNNEKNEKWESRFKNSDKWKEKILAFYISKNSTEDTGLVIEVGNVSYKEYSDLYNVWIKMFDWDYLKVDTSYGEILTDEDLIGEVYVNGLKVDCNSELKYGYNFKPRYIKLERDRKTCDSWNVGDITSKMIAEAMVKGDIKIETVKKMVESNADDVYHLDFNTYNSNVQEVQKMLVVAFDEEYGGYKDAIPVETQEQYRLVAGYGGYPVIVPCKVANLVKEETKKRISDLISKPEVNTLTMKEKFQRWYDIYSEQLKTQAKTELCELITMIDK